jgi:hypothetical protein
MMRGAKRDVRVPCAFRFISDTFLVEDLFWWWWWWGFSHTFCQSKKAVLWFVLLQILQVFKKAWKLLAWKLFKSYSPKSVFKHFLIWADLVFRQPWGFSHTFCQSKKAVLWFVLLQILQVFKKAWKLMAWKLFKS